MKRLFTAIITALLCCGSLDAQIVVDGELDAGGYTRIATQMVQTQFGDAISPGYFGSELDAMYVGQEGSRIFVMLTGNLEGNFNKLEVFIDSVAGGENVVSSVPQYDFLAGDGPNWQSQLLGGIVSGGPGLTFDTGFEVDYHLFFRRGFAGDDGDVFDADFADRQGGVNAMIPVNGGRTALDFATQTAAGAMNVGDLGMNSAGDAIANPIDIAINNSNEAGIGGGTGAADMVAAEAVTTGVEFSIDVADLGLDPANSADIRIVAMVNGGSHDYLSNQILPALMPGEGNNPGDPEGTSNLGGDGAGNFQNDLGNVDLNQFAGDQFATISYEGDGGGVLLGDVNCDGLVNLLDVAPFVDLISSGMFNEKADIDGNGLVNLLDVGPFVDLLTGG